jgi:two-component system chemotaxis sensor kinase CheA
MDTRAEEFVNQAREHLGALEQLLVAIERTDQQVATREALDACLRIVHSLKGDAGFLGLTAIRTLSDAMETALEAQRDSGNPLPPFFIENVLRARDRLASLVDDLENSNGADLGEIQTRLASSLSNPEVEPRVGVAAGDLAAEREPSVPIAIDLEAWQRATGRSLVALFGDIERIGTLEERKLDLKPGDLGQRLPGGPILFRATLRTPLSSSEVIERLGLAGATGQMAQGAGQISVPAIGTVSAIEHSPPTTAARRSAAIDEERSASLRIKVELLDRLMTLVSELTLLRNQSLLACADDDGPLRPIVQRLSAVTSSLQDTVLRTRMQPVSNLFGKFPRVVRDLGRQLGKQVDVAIVGRDVELDKTILEQLADPLTHLVRNSVDHGIETPASRIAAGKPATGQLTLAASHEDGQVRIEIRDDGRGIDPLAIRAKAIAMRLKTEAELDRMSTRELYSLILLPGFSTASQVTDVSGRGVGMDVVRTNIELLEGSLSIDSQPGVGTAMIIRLPLTLAIIPCLIVVVAGERYAIPQRELEEVVCIHPGLKGRIEEANDTEFYRLRDRLLPIIRLSEVFERRRPFTPLVRAEIVGRYAEFNRAPTRSQYFVVVRQEEKRFGLLVDDIGGTEEIVVKPMNTALRRVGIFSGATIMGDGRVALIANVPGIIQHARVNFETQLSNAPTAPRSASAVHRFLLFEYGPNEQFAMPLMQIRRIEPFDPARIEVMGNHEYFNIGGVATRILRLDRVVTVSSCPPERTTHLVLPRFAREPTGIAISRIVDSESLALELQPPPNAEKGILGTGLARGRLTLFVDSGGLVDRLLEPAAAVAPRTRLGQIKARILLVDDTPFFRETIGRSLSDAGYDVAAAIHGHDAIDMLARETFDMVVSDIEMPVMDGWTFARQAREQGFRGPLLALSSLSKLENEAKARSCGFDAYEEKLNPDRLIQTVEQMLQWKQTA